MNAIRNSSDHAVFVAVGVVAVLLAIGIALFLAARSATFPKGGVSGGLEIPKAGLR